MDNADRILPLIMIRSDSSDEECPVYRSLAPLFPPLPSRQASAPTSQGFPFRSPTLSRQSSTGETALEFAFAPQPCDKGIPSFAFNSPQISRQPSQESECTVAPKMFELEMEPRALIAGEPDDVVDDDVGGEEDDEDDGAELELLSKRWEQLRLENRELELHCASTEAALKTQNEVNDALANAMRDNNDATPAASSGAGHADADNSLGKRQRSLTTSAATVPMHPCKLSSPQSMVYYVAPSTKEMKKLIDEERRKNELYREQIQINAAMLEDLRRINADLYRELAELKQRLRLQEQPQDHMNSTPSDLER